MALAAVIWLAKLGMECEPRVLSRGWTVTLLFLVGLQILLGVETWLSKFFVPQAPWNQLEPLALHQDFVRSIHYVTGTLVFATTTAATVLVWRPATAPASAAARPLEGTA